MTQQAQSFYEYAGDAVYAEAVTPSDTQELKVIGRALYIGTAGDLTVITKGGGVPVTLVAVPGGSLLPIAVRQVLATGTTATNIVSLA